MQEKQEDILVKLSAGEVRRDGKYNAREVRRDIGKIQCKRSKKRSW